jgi:hypothetical protein
LDTLRGSKEPLSPLDVADLTGKSHAAIRQMLIRMATSGEVVRASRGRYHCDSVIGVTNDVTMESPLNSPSDSLSDSLPSTPCHKSHLVTKAENNNNDKGFTCDAVSDSALPDRTESQSTDQETVQADGQSDIVTDVTRGHHREESQATLECWGVCASEGVRKRYYPDAKPHPAKVLIAFRTGSYTARLCRDHAKTQFSHKTYAAIPPVSGADYCKLVENGQWWTRAGLCSVCGIEVYLNPSEKRIREKNPERQLLCSTTCGRAPRRSSREAMARRCGVRTVC